MKSRTNGHGHAAKSYAKVNSLEKNQTDPARCGANATQRGSSRGAGGGLMMKTELGICPIMRGPRSGPGVGA